MSYVLGATLPLLAGLLVLRARGSELALSRQDLRERQQLDLYAAYAGDAERQAVAQADQREQANSRAV